MEDNHEAIVSPEVFDLVQEEIAAQERREPPIAACSSFSGVQLWRSGGLVRHLEGPHSNDRYRRTASGSAPATSRESFGLNPASDGRSQEKVTAAMQRLSDDRVAVLPRGGKHSDSVYDTSALQDELCLRCSVTRVAQQTAQTAPSARTRPSRRTLWIISRNEEAHRALPAPCGCIRH